jgi:hypothetical protein
MSKPKHDPAEAMHFLDLRSSLTFEQRQLWDAYVLALMCGHALVAKGLLTLDDLERAGHDITDDRFHVESLVRTLRRDLPDDRD